MISLICGIQTNSTSKPVYKAEIRLTDIESKLRVTKVDSAAAAVRLCATAKTAAHQAPPSLGFSRQEHWSGLPFPSPVHENEK